MGGRSRDVKYGTRSEVDALYIMQDEVGLRTGTDDRQWRELPRAASALIAPRLTDRIGTARATAAVPAEWRHEVDAWLQRVRTAHEPGLVGDRDGRNR